MGSGRPEQIERKLEHLIATDFGEKPWGQVKRRPNAKQAKIQLHRRERRRSKKDPECGDESRKYQGYEY